jgi:hypothetical protein
MPYAATIKLPLFSINDLFPEQLLYTLRSQVARNYVKMVMKLAKS